MVARTSKKTNAIRAQSKPISPNRDEISFDF
jgi:hypothetical protein